MKTKLLSVIALLVIPSTQVLARPSLTHMDQKLDILVACPPGAPTRFVDNGDGTLCDHETGLMWEMKNASDGAPDALNPRDVDNTYAWSGEASFSSTVFNGFLTRLNGETARTPTSEQLGGYSDWRLPTSAELQAIRDCSSDTAIDIPCIAPIFGPTAVTSSYWTSTSRAGLSSSAWTVRFGTSIPVPPVAITDKFSSRYARAVRGNGRAAVSSPVVRNPVIGIGSR